MKKNLLILLIVAVATAAIAYAYFTKSNSTIDDTTTGFAVKDTAAIDHIFIADQNGNTIDLKRSGSTWKLNDTLFAREDAVNLLLRVFSDIEVSAPVAKTAQENTLKYIASYHRKVEIYQNGSTTPTKIWYVGHPTQQHYGTHMLLETPEHGKAEEAYVMHLRWHNGFLTPMFFTELVEWRSTLLIDYPANAITKVTVVHHDNPQETFTLTQGKNNVLTLLDQNNQPASELDTLFARDFLNNFRNLHYESIDKYQTPLQRDSMLNSTPLTEVIITDLANKVQNTKIYIKEKPVRELDIMTGEQVQGEFDRNRNYALSNNNEVVLIQRYVFDKITYGLSDFKRN